MKRLVLALCTLMALSGCATSVNGVYLVPEGRSCYQFTGTNYHSMLLTTVATLAGHTGAPISSIPTFVSCRLTFIEARNIAADLAIETQGRVVAKNIGTGMTIRARYREELDNCKALNMRYNDEGLTYVHTLKVCKRL